MNPRPTASTPDSPPGGDLWSPVALFAPAKINLFLKVVGRRPDGYHDIESLFCPVGLYDRIRLSPGDTISLRCEADHVPSDDTNLAHRAAVLFISALRDNGHPLRRNGIHIDLHKRIPVGAGLGGGSSDAAAVLTGLNRIYQNPFDIKRLSAMAVSLGADVPFFLTGRPALATGIGDQLRPIQNLPKYYAIIVYPGIHTATGDVYKRLKIRLTKPQKKISYFHFTGRDFDVHQHLVNDLESVTENDHPEITAAKSMLRQQGALGALMSGSGSSVFGLFASKGKARQALAALTLPDLWQAHLVPLLV